jgi:hypothetical protein
MPRKPKPMPSSSAGSILRLRIRLLGISPMIWRRVLVPGSSTLQELHGVIQAAMGWEGLHLYAFRIRAVRYGSLELGIESPAVTLESFRLRRNAKLTYVYDMGDWWEHEVRVEDRIEAAARKHYPHCAGGQGACPPEECGGPQGYQARREEASGFDALEDLATMAGLLKKVVLERKPELLDDPDRRDELEMAVARMKARQPFLDNGFSLREVNARFRKDEHRRLMDQCY